MKALVIGADGLLGSHVVRTLLDEGTAVRAGRGGDGISLFDVSNAAGGDMRLEIFIRSMNER